ncbi:MAG: hypothetical protein ACLUV3_01505 [Oscillospiraceae bacterium]
MEATITVGESKEITEMTNTSKERNDLFKNECKIINLKYEYEGYTGTEQWAIVSELTEKELFEFLIEFKIRRLRIFSYLALPRGIKYKSPFPSKGKDLTLCEAQTKKQQQKSTVKLG